MVFSRYSFSCLLILPLALSACGHSHSAAKTSIDAASQMRAAKLVTLPPLAPAAVILPKILPGQLKKLEREKARRKLASPLDRVARANRKARVQPAGEGFINAVQIYPWQEGALYQVYTAPGKISDIALQAGEKLIGSGAIAAGDTVRWVIGDTISGTGVNARVHILVKPTASRLSTNLIINTDRRTYHLELKSTRTAYMASVSWTYPHDEMLVLQSAQRNADNIRPVARGLDLGKLNFAYKISGDKPDWRPLRVFDDGRQVFIAFPKNIAQGEMPPLFVLGRSGKAELVNYRVRKNHMIVDRLFEVAELRLGGKKQQVVRIKRTKRARR